MSPLEQYLEMVAPEFRDLVCVIDALVRKAAPDLVPSLKWGNLTYHHTKNVCAIVAHDKYLNIQVWLGAAIQDPEGLLVGSGKRMRHIRVTASHSFSRRAVAAIIRASAAATRVAI